MWGFQRRFNSTLVRLEAQAYLSKNQSRDVSIPLWFDWKHGQNAFGLNSRLFQFHFGSIGSKGNTFEVILNSVSIPLWFDWKYLSV